MSAGLPTLGSEVEASMPAAARDPADPLALRPELAVAPLAVLGLAVILLFFFGFGVWAARAPLQSAAIAPGVVTVDSKRKTVQHLEGGLIAAIKVADGDQVREGQVLLELDDAETRAEVAILKGRLAVSLAMQARLEAERNGSEELGFPEEIDGLTKDAGDSEQLWLGEERIFAERRRFLVGQEELKRRQVAQLAAEIGGLEEEIDTENRQLALIEEERSALADLVDKGLARRPRLLELERAKASIEGARARNTAAIARAQQRIEEIELSIIDVRNRVLNEVVTGLQDLRSEIADLRDRLTAAEERLERTKVRAPVDGTVVDLRVFTDGGVLRPGEAILDLVPKGDALAVEAQIEPADVDVVKAGLPAEVRIGAFSVSQAPLLAGQVMTVSADSLTDERSGRSYYAARIMLDDLSALPPGAILQPGMPAEVMIITGERTALEYLLDPLRHRVSRAMREE